MSPPASHAPATRCVHAGAPRGEAREGLLTGLNTPIVSSTAFDYTRDTGVRYPRYLNTPNHQAVADKLTALEGAEAALVTASGMGAVSAVMLALLRPGDHAILLSNLYGGTTDLADGLLAPLGIELSRWDGDPATLAAQVRPETRLALVESPTNPLMRVIDLAAAAEVLRARDIHAVIDNTFATPVLQNPLALGFDLVVHSGTKYLGGHSDLLCGAVLGARELVDRVAEQAVRLGSALNGQDLALLERSLKTLSLRVERQCANAQRLAEWLADDPRIAGVHYPGLPGDPGHAVAREQMRAFGGMLGFRVAGSVDPGAFLAQLRLVTPAVSLGGVESTVCQPSRTSHAGLDAEGRAALGIDDRLMRFSTGIEDPEDLIADLDRALVSA